MNGCDVMAVTVLGLFPVLLLLKLFWMPGFFKHIPKAEPGDWMAVAMKVSPFFGRREVAWKRCRNLRSAYFAARWLALKVDHVTPYCDGELGVDWGVRNADPKLDPEGV